MKAFWSRVCTLTGLLLSGIWPVSPAIAQWRPGGQWIDASGELVITVMDRWGRSCASGTAQASYTVAGGAGGLLYPDDCDDNSGRARFEDTEGRERCVGASIWRDSSSGSNRERETTWVIEAPVPGFACSTVGQTYSVKLYFSAPPPAMNRRLDPSTMVRIFGWQKELRNARSFNLRPGIYFRASNSIGIYQHESRLCYVGTSRNGRLVASLSERPEQLNTYYFDGSDDSGSNIFQINAETLGYGNSEYVRELSTPAFSQLPFDLQECLSSEEPYYESDEPPRRR